MLISFKMSLCRCIILAIVLCSKHSTALQYSTLLVHFWNQCKKLIRMGYHGKQRSCPEVGPLSLYHQLMIFRVGPPYLFTMSWWFPEVVPLLQYKLMIFKGVPLYLCTICFSEVGLLIFLLWVDDCQRWAPFYTLMIFRCGPLYLCTISWCFSEVVPLFLYRHSSFNAVFWAWEKPC